MVNVDFWDHSVVNSSLTLKQYAVYTVLLMGNWIQNVIQILFLSLLCFAGIANSSDKVQV